MWAFRVCLLNCNVIINTGFKDPPVGIGQRSISFCLSVTIRITKKQSMEKKVVHRLQFRGAVYHSRGGMAAGM